jgi:metal-responsive CopG/Arc/MetJ family transcriptional regulator
MEMFIKKVSLYNGMSEKKLVNFYLEEELIKKIDMVIEASENQYKDRTQFITIALQNAVLKEFKKKHLEDPRPDEV